MPTDLIFLSEIHPRSRSENRSSPGDISHEGFCQRLVADAVEQLGRLDILVNNAGKTGKIGGISTPPSASTH